MEKLIVTRIDGPNVSDRGDLVRMGMTIEPLEHPSQLQGVDLSGWKVEVWHSLVLKTGEEGEGRKVAGYFKDQAVGMAAGRGKSSWGQDGALEMVFVLTSDGSTGFLLVGNQVAVSLSQEEELREAARARAVEKLNPEDREILGLD